jgi:hypothetical protein
LLLAVGVCCSQHTVGPALTGFNHSKHKASILSHIEAVGVDAPSPCWVQEGLLAAGCDHSDLLRGRDFLWVVPLKRSLSQELHGPGYKAQCSLALGDGVLAEGCVKLPQPQIVRFHRSLWALSSNLACQHQHSEQAGVRALLFALQQA